ncbi:hypothetical protein CJ178_30755 [Rhodococcus sp. ACPA4]|nr:hypothetical protein CJ178_30755 [Rhodococcus sp. ACPA4]
MAANDSSDTRVVSLHAEDSRVLRWIEIHPTMSVTFATKSGSAENLNASLRHGCTPYSRQICATVPYPIPRRA